MRRAVGPLGRLRQDAADWLMSQPHAPHALAAARILVGLSVLGLLVTNFSNRQMWVGDASLWAEPTRAVSRFPEIALLDGVSADILTVAYVIVLLAAVAFIVGWHTKAANVVLLVGFIAVTGQNPLLATATDNLLRITLLWMLLMRLAEVWSLDVAREGGDSDQAVPDWLRTGLHNVALVGLGTQVALAYLAAGLHKVAQTSWQQGTALYSTLQLPEFRPFPAVADLLSLGTVPLALVTWLVLVVQLFFVPALLRPFTRDLFVAAAVGVNVLFGVVLATPWSSLVVIAATSLFLSDERWQDIGFRVADRCAPVTDRVVDAWYAVADKVDDWWYRFVRPIVDWVRVTVLRRRPGGRRVAQRGSEEPRE
ncbi:HTTM domain-containing protein [Aeromicrobium sp. CTD01-1L150]|uniref:HTTM domain-containing protein n=1 Tax=Aeromicrobium sp. CTD01-1L150 TaxID=3341830 RepID=UPI0035C1B32F